MVAMADDPVALLQMCIAVPLCRSINGGQSGGVYFQLEEMSIGSVDISFEGM
jgi:hypothetical protein